MQNRIKQEVGKKKVSESNLKTSLVLYGSGSSNYGSDDFVNSKGSAASSEASSNYEGGTSEAAGGGSVSTYNGGTTYSNNYSENTGTVSYTHLGTKHLSGRSLESIGSSSSCWCFDFNCISSLGQGDRLPSACSGYFTLIIRKNTEEIFGVFSCL